MSVVPSEMYDMLKRHMDAIDRALTMPEDSWEHDVELLRMEQKQEWEKLLAKYEERER